MERMLLAAGILALGGAAALGSGKNARLANFFGAGGALLAPASGSSLPSLFWREGRSTRCAWLGACPSDRSPWLWTRSPRSS
jgi:hypothetical protein